MPDLAVARKASVVEQGVRSVVPLRWLVACVHAYASPHQHRIVPIDRLAARFANGHLWGHP